MQEKAKMNQATHPLSDKWTNAENHTSYIQYQNALSKNKVSSNHWNRREYKDKVDH
mgnify:CR=1 FL=1